MENTYTKFNNLTGWAVFAIATIVYIMTMEPTASFWDCGEFIATAHKLEVGHPPGAPLWLMMAKVFGLLAGDNVENVAYFMNMFSALSSSFTVLFLFWSITHMAKKMVTRNGKRKFSMGDTLAIIFAGAIGSLAYAFSDSFWFSAVEGEVYAASSLFTAAVFWLILKWERVADEQGSDRYLIFIAYLMGLSIGVHLLNLLVIPPIALVYYFRKNKPTLKGGIIAFVIGFIVLVFIQYGVIQKAVKLASKFEWALVNGMGLPKHGGVLVFIIVVFGGLLYFMRRSVLKNHTIMYRAFMALTVLLFGYSSFAMIVIRSSADTPMDENNPEDIFSLLPYLNREQYGDRPLGYGHTFLAPISADEEGPASSDVIYWDEEKQEYYVAVEGEKSKKPAYQKEFNMLFPRMYSREGKHKSHYKSWSNFEGEQVEYIGRDGKPTYGLKPTFGENMSFFVNYQIRFMYWRYFMWNFSGKQNDIQGHGSPLEGNWISGVEMIDKEMIGSSEKLPDEMRNNAGRNLFYMLPLILGLIGVFLQMKFDKETFVVTLSLFIMTGLAIIVYLNQTPLQPRERDYAYAASFYAFAIWIGLGVVGLYQAMKEKEELKWEEIFTYGGSFIGMGILAFAIESAGGSTHEFSYSMMYIGVVGIGLVALAKVIGGAIKDNKTQALLAMLLTVFVPYQMGAEGWDDHDRSNRYTSRDFAINYLESCAPNAIIFTMGDNDTFPLWYVQEVEGIRTDVRVVNLSLLNTDWYITQMKRKAYDSEPVPFSLEEHEYRQGGSRDMIVLDPKKSFGRQIPGLNSSNEFVELSKVMKHYVKNDKRIIHSEYPWNYSPSSKFKITIDQDDVQKLIKSGAFTEADSNKVVDAIKWEIEERQLYKNKLMILDLLATNDWERPVYFAITVGGDNYLNLEPYFQLEGLAYRVVPIKTPDNGSQMNRGSINSDIMYDNFMNKFKWGNLNHEDVYLDENNRRMCMNFRSNFSALAEQLIEENKLDSAQKVLDRCLEVIPNSKVPYDYFNAQIARGYVQINREDKAKEIITEMKNNSTAKLDYFFSLRPELASNPDIKTAVEREIKYNLMACMYVVNDMDEPGDLAKDMEEAFSYYNQLASTLFKFVQGQIDAETYKNQIESYEMDFFNKSDGSSDLIPSDVSENDSIN